MIKWKRVSPDAVAPVVSTDGSGAIDLYSTEDVLIIPGFSEVVPLGVAFEIPRGWVGFLTHRSSMAFKLDCVASFGVIDSDYRGEVKAKLYNIGTEGVYIKKGDKVCQICVVPHYTYSTYLEEVDELGETERGTGGFGSTGE